MAPALPAKLLVTPGRRAGGVWDRVPPFVRLQVGRADLGAAAATVCRTLEPMTGSRCRPPPPAGSVLVPRRGAHVAGLLQVQGSVVLP
jgi:hypothetical protein